jgi:hypothetical protein
MCRAQFSEACFYDKTYFNSVEFSEGLYLGKAKFSKQANFNAATISETADFEKAVFSMEVSFTDVAFSSDASFREVKFLGKADFHKARFATRLHFNRALFKKFAPDFRDALIPETLEWPEETNRPDAPTREKAEEAEKFEDRVESQIHAYAALKSVMESRKRHDDEQFFFAKELHARRVLLSPWASHHWANFLYQHLSGYGRGITRPLACFAGLYVFGVTLFALLPVEDTSGKLPAPLGVIDAIRLNLGVLFPFVPFKLQNRMLVWPAEIFANIETIFGAVLLFLFGLALRNRFRMK